ncbi:unnamed protein product, partial [Rotaria magnacalcarata]
KINKIDDISNTLEGNLVSQSSLLVESSDSVSTKLCT